MHSRRQSLVQLLSLAAALVATDRSWTAYADASYAFLPPGVPKALPTQVIVAGRARFTVLTKYLLRLEYDNEVGDVTKDSDDEQTYVVWNRAFPAVPFTHSTTAAGATVIDTGGLKLVYTGGSFTASSLSITMAEPNWLNVSVWTPSSSSEGNLFGTFHNLDGLDGWQDMNCSHAVNGALGPDPMPDDTRHDQASYGHFWCAMGLISKSGWAVIDDSRSPVFTNDTNSGAGGWLAPQHKGQCATDVAEKVNCLAPAATPVWGTRGNSTPAERKLACEVAGCCFVPSAPVPPAPPPYIPGPDRIALQQFFGHNENVLTTPAHPPKQPGYTSALGIVGYALKSPPPSALAGEYNQLKLYYLASPPDHWTTATAADENAAVQAGYKLIAPLAWVPVKPQGNFTAPIALYYSPSRHDHYASLNNCQGCPDYKLLHLDGYACPPPTVPPPPPPTGGCFRRGGGGRFDSYFFGHGVGTGNYRLALTDFARLSGPIPVPRRHQLGMSWSRWSEGPVAGEPWPGLQADMVAAVKGLEATSFPLDQFIFDMNWHLKTTGWTGYTWDTKMYPNHTELLDWLHSQDIFTAANLHDASGVSHLEQRSVAMIAALCNRTTVRASGDVPNHVTNQMYMTALHDQILAPLALEGLDFWWTDWQQQLLGWAPGPPDALAVGSTDMATPVNPTMLFNHYRTFNPQPLHPSIMAKIRPKAILRGATHSRFGGLGGHRYPTQFGGDVTQSWSSLDFFPYHVSTAANVLVSYWAEEIMNGQGSVVNQQLFTRVIQFGAWSPVFTTWGNKNNPNNLWTDHDFPPPYRNASQLALAHRAMTLPYRYTLAHEATSTGLSPTRPMYYDWPWEPSAYDTNASGRQFMLGESMLVAPVTSALSCGSGPTQASPKLPNCSSGVATTRLWLPDASENWLPAFNNSPALPHSAGAGVVNVSSNLSQVPVYVRRGAVLPTLPYATAIKHGSASRAFDPLTWVVYGPTSGGGSGYALEDDGLTTENETVRLHMHYTLTGEGRLNVTYGGTGTYFGAPATRRHSIMVVQPTSACGHDDDEESTLSANVGLVVLGANGSRLTQLADCANAIRSGLVKEQRGQPSGWCVDETNGNLFIVLPRLGATKIASASVYGLCER